MLSNIYAGPLTALKDASILLHRLGLFRYASVFSFWQASAPRCWRLSTRCRSAWLATFRAAPTV